MCLAVPGRIARLEENSMATIDITGVTRVVSLDLVPEAQVGDWVLVHAGFALQVVDEQYAQETLDLLRTLPFFDDGEPLIAENV